MINVIIMVGILLLLVVTNLHVGGGNFVKDGFVSSGKFVLSYSILLLLMFLIAGQAQVLTIKYLDVLRVWMTGGKGLIGSWLAGMTAPGGIATFPIIKDLWDKDINRQTLFVYLVAVQMLNWQAVMFRLPLLGWKITAMLYGVGFIVTVIVVVIMFFVLKI